MTVVQCWDDAVTTDVRLIEILRRHKTKATFNINFGLHHKKSKPEWMHRGTEVSRLAFGDLKTVYEGFTIASHSLTHPHLDQIPLEEAQTDIVDGRKRLQDFFCQPVLGFAYPFGTYNDAVKDLLREAGHVYARTVGNIDQPFPPKDPMAFDPCCHFLASDFWSRYEKARQGGVFYFWGHSYEMIEENMWQEFEETIRRISADPAARWADVADLFLNGEELQRQSQMNADGHR